jgi:hypothetical protein
MGGLEEAHWEDLSHREYHLVEVDMGNTDDMHHVVEDKKDRYRVVEGRECEGIDADHVP